MGEKMFFSLIILSYVGTIQICSRHHDGLNISFKMVYHMLRSEEYSLRYQGFAEDRPLPVVSILN